MLKSNIIVLWVIMEAALFLIDATELEKIMLPQWQHVEKLPLDDASSTLYLGQAWRLYHEVLNRYSVEPIPVLNYVIQAESILPSDLVSPENLSYNSRVKVAAIYQALQSLNIDQLKKRYQQYFEEQADHWVLADEITVAEFSFTYSEILEFYQVATRQNKLVLSRIQYKIQPQHLP